MVSFVFRAMPESFKNALENMTLYIGMICEDKNSPFWGKKLIYRLEILYTG